MSKITRRRFVICTGAVAAGSQLGPTLARTPVDTGFENPLEQATVVWNMATLEGSGRHPFALTESGAKTVLLGQKLEGAEYAESIQRGGDGRVAVFGSSQPSPDFIGMSVSKGDGWLSLDAQRAGELRPQGTSVSLYIRALFQQPDGHGTLLFSDSIGLALHKSGLAVAFLAQKTAAGAVYRELPLALLDRGRWLDLIVRVGPRQLEFFCNGTLRSSIPLARELGPAFQSELLIGAFEGLAALSGKRSLALSNAKLDTIALWDQALTDAQVAHLSGQTGLQSKLRTSPVDRTIAAYNRFHDASEKKDLELCRRLERSMREFMWPDPNRPIYHLTAPIGWIFDPSGAFQFQGKYHISSYRNIYAALRFNSLDHYVSNDLVHWRLWPIGPLADTPNDVGALWLSNYLIDAQGKPNVIYAGCGADGKERGIRARSDDGMISFTDKKVVLPDYHDGHSWKESDTWYVATMRNTPDMNRKDPEIVLFSSTDLDHWTERGVLFRPSDYVDRKMGGMEFPYFFMLGDKAVVMSGCLPAGVLYWIGRYDRESFKFIPDDPEPLRVDYANPFHCFNPSAVDAKGPNGSPRRIIMALESRAAGSVQGLPWNGAHVMPRALTLEGNHLRQDPLPEFEVLRGRRYSLKDIEITPDTSGYIKARGDALEIRAVFENHGASQFGLKVRLSPDGQTFVRVFYDTATDEYGVEGDFAPSFLRYSFPKLGRGAAYVPKGAPVELIVFLDKVMIETFLNGQPCSTCLKDSNPLHDGLDFFSEGGSVKCTRLDVWEMRSSL